MKDYLTDKLFDLFNWLGVDPIYGATFISTLVAIWVLIDLKNWQEKAAWQKFVNVVVILGVITIYILFIMRLFNSI